MERFEVPIFTGDGDGVDLEFWIEWMEHYFARSGDFTEDQKLQMGWGFIYGEALDWLLNMERQSHDFATWDSLKTTLRWFRYQSLPAMVRGQHIKDIQEELVKIVRESLATIRTQIYRMSDSVLDTSQGMMKKIEMPIVEEPRSISISTLPHDATNDSTSNGENVSVAHHMLDKMSLRANKQQEDVETDSIIVVSSDRCSMCSAKTVNTTHLVLAESYHQAEDSIVLSKFAKISENLKAHQVLDEMTPRRYKNQKLRKERKTVASKSWMFKYKRVKKKIRTIHNQDWFNTWSRRVGIGKNKTVKLQYFSDHKLFVMTSFQPNKSLDVSHEREAVQDIQQLQVGKETTIDDVTVKGECASLVPQRTEFVIPPIITSQETTKVLPEKEISDDNVTESKREELQEVVERDLPTPILCWKEDSGVMNVVSPEVANINGHQTAHQVFVTMTKRRKKRKKRHKTILEQMQKITSAYMVFEELSSTRNLHIQLPDFTVITPIAAQLQPMNMCLGYKAFMELKVHFKGLASSEVEILSPDCIDKIALPARKAVDKDSSQVLYLLGCVHNETGVPSDENRVWGYASDSKLREIDALKSDTETENAGSIQAISDNLN